MSGFEIRENTRRKVTGVTEHEFEDEPAQQLRAIIKVQSEGYVPRNVIVRSRIDDEMFVAEFSSELLEELERDEDISSVAVAKRLKIVE